jgi:hypothetical protein
MADGVLAWLTRKPSTCGLKARIALEQLKTCIGEWLLVAQVSA